MMNSEDIIAALREENEKIKEQINKYLQNNKKYYETHKEEHKQRVKEYKKRTNYNNNYVPTPEKKKEYARRAYLKKGKIREREKF